MLVGGGWGGGRGVQPLITLPRPPTTPNMHVPSPLSLVYTYKTPATHTSLITVVVV